MTKQSMVEHLDRIIKTYHGEIARAEKIYEESVVAAKSKYFKAIDRFIEEAHSLEEES